MAELGVREVARLLGVAEKTVWRGVRAGPHPFTTLDGLLRLLGQLA